ncbi:hypothetical protein FNO01nite_11210 [Flavobacterium noncentrifugens]|uniref:KTSC domain-containing protein n=2 Tax=Flavobacterium noncentrifugens TaxID=1128970 RepID=A0A1G8VDD5_9FLAO|nr:hypothetical protein FNO01nite_11210 [Flavobacterium noncentrifugens]SDJ63897.1 hypothetical protein SAMN04487935_1294 [Flavobacterium noncentrifugens]
MLSGSDMKTYKNLSGNSGIKAYQISQQSIRIAFSDGSVYLYNYASNGKRAVEIMKGLAEKGIGLTTYINQEVRDQYAEKLK